MMNEVSLLLLILKLFDFLITQIEQSNLCPNLIYELINSFQINSNIKIDRTKNNNHPYNQMISPQTQPLITEQIQKSNSSPINYQRQQQIPKQKSTLLPYDYQPQTSQKQFFQIMDTVDEYDKLIKEMNDLYTEGMLTIANVKFINPYSSLSTKGFKPTPAITKVSIRDEKKQQQEGKVFTLVTDIKNIRFTNSVIDSIHSEKQHTREEHNNNHNQNPIQQPESETESHSAHSSQSTANQLYSYEEEQMIIEEEETIQECRKLVESEKFQKDEFILQRFNIESQKDIVIQGINKFDLLLKKLLQIAERKFHIDQKFNSIELKSKQK